MKIILVDNFDRDEIPDVLVAENVDPLFGAHIVERMNQAEGESSPHFYRLVEDDHKLYVPDYML